MSKKSFLIVGITEQSFNKEKDKLQALINTHFPGKILFSGGERHHTIVKEILPVEHEWVNVTAPITETLHKYERYNQIIVFASGDPLFYGFGETIMREFPNAEINIIPDFNSLQLLAAKTKQPYGTMKNISLTGRDWDNLYEALIREESLIGILTDRKKTPDEIAKRMLEYGYDNYLFTIGENLGSKEECIFKGITPEKAVNMSFKSPNCLILRKTTDRKKYFGIEDHEFITLRNRPKMITKMPARLLDLSLLELNNKSVLWDIGFCTGSLSIEAKLSFPHLKIIAFEKREECKDIIEANIRKFGSPGIKIVMGDFMETDISHQPNPDAVFIGGHGGELNKMIEKLKPSLQNNAVITFNSVSNKSKEDFYSAIESNGLTIEKEYNLTIDSHNPLSIIKASWKA